MAAHVKHSPSSAYRWTACPGSIRLIAVAPPEKTSAFAAEGTGAHDLLERCLRDNLIPANFVGQVVGDHRGKVTVTDEMAEAVQVALDHVTALIEEGDIVFIERRFDLASLNPPAPLRGTADVVIYKPSTGRLIVIDYKHGQGVAVGARGNMQMRTYALGACVALGEAHPVREVEAMILQPRAYHPDGPMRTECLEPFELMEWSADLFEAQARTLEPDAPLVAGDHCRFCSAAGICPALASKALAVAEADFETIEAEKAPPAPETLTPEQIGRVLAAGDTLEKWLSAVRQHAAGMLERGETVPGWKLVEKRGTRKWDCEDHAAAGVIAQMGVPQEDVYVRKIISPAQAEKLVGKAAYREHLEPLVTKQSSGTTLAPEADKRPAVTPGDDFDAIAAE